MTTQLRDTQFGHLVRVLTGKRWLQYPDEIDVSLSKKFVDRKVVRGKQDDSNASNGKEKLEYETTRARNGVETDLEALHTNEADSGHPKTYLVDWYRPDDPENPQNWPRNWKLLVVLEICILNFAVYSASSIYVPGEPSLMEDFNVGEVPATLGLSLFTAGYGLGPMILSPMSDIPSLGRRGIYFWTLLAFVLFQLPVGYATDLGMFLVFRMVTGFCGSPCLSTGGATISDMYQPAQVPFAVCIWGSFGILGPVFGPIIGGFVAPVKGWRWTIWVIAWLCSIVLIVFFFLLPETSAANILYRRAERLRLATGDKRYRSQSEIDAAKRTWEDHAKVLARAFTLTFGEPIIFLLDTYTALLYGVLFIWFESFPLVFGGIYGFDSGEQGLVFLAIFVGAVITLPLFLLWLRRYIAPVLSLPNFKPEKILVPTFFGSAALPICLFWYGWSARSSVHWIVPTIGSGFFSVAIITLFNPVLTYLGLAYPSHAASVYAGNALFRASFGAAFPLFARQLFYKLGIGPGNSLLGGFAVCFMILPVLFYTYGKRIRDMSKNARHDV